MMCFGLKDRKRLKTNHCVIVLLDDTQLVHELHASTTGQDLLDVVIKHLNLLETSYFGLRYFPNGAGGGGNSNDHHQLQLVKRAPVWLDVERSALKQLRDVQPMTVYFGVKYYAPDPCKLAEEITRYQFFLQCKQDILHGRLPIPFELAVELFALAVQSELGDYDPQRHQPGYVGEFQFLPANQTLELERRVALFHRNLTGQVPATAELNFLERVKWLDLYGCDLHQIQYDDEDCGQYAGGSSIRQAEDEYALGLNPSGVSVLRNKLKVAHYVWQRIVKTKCQGRCFLMDVMGNLAAEHTGGSSNNNRSSSSASAPQQPPQQQRQRFGFRLADKQTSRRLRLSLEQHKSFYHLINNSATLNQLVAAQHQQQQRQKFSQRFRHSIRSAIQLGASSSGSAIGSQLMHHQASQRQLQQRQMQLRSSMKSQQQQQQYLQDSSRQPPTVVRMPSRRYGSRAAPANGLPASSSSSMGLQHAHTMLDHQRQQALMMMNQLNHMNQSSTMAVKSQTLKPISSKQAAANREKNQYYHQMMMAMMANQQQQQQQQQQHAFLAPGQHVLHQQPNIYKASSVINGINQLANKESMMQQLFNTRPQYPAQRGHESPRSTKSAIAPSSALKLASKKLAKQQQQLLYGAGAGDVQPLLAFDPMQQPQQQQMYSNYYGVSTAYNVNSANASPRSARSARLSNSRHRSKSTSENLHLLHNAAANGKMLLATATQLMQQQQQQQQQQQLMQRPAPPTYNGNVRPEPKYSDNESELSKMSASKRHQMNRKRATFALTNEQANILLSAQNELAAKNRKRNPIMVEPEDDYCCSRSDCSSVDQQQPRRRRPEQQLQQQTKSNLISEHSDWNSIRRRHENFSRGKAFQLVDESAAARDANNNNPSQLVKNIANKQATPILLSMNFDQQGVNGGNSKAVQLLNQQRQQLNSSSSTQSASSSEASSPKQQHLQQAPVKTKADSTVSNSTTTSGYYAGSNSTGSASADSDSQQSSTKPQLAGSRAKIALGSYSIQSRMSGDRLLIGNQAHLKQPTAQVAKQQFYLGDQSNISINNNNNNTTSESKPNPLSSENQENWQHQPASLKYVSFDV